MRRPSAAPARTAPARRWAGRAVGAAVLALVFWLYADPDFVVMMANQVWSCF